MNENREPTTVVPVAAFRANLAEYMDAVRRGATVVITNYGKPVAELRPTSAEIKTVVVGV